MGTVGDQLDVGLDGRKGGRGEKGSIMVDRDSDVDEIRFRNNR